MLHSDIIHTDGAAQVTTITLTAHSGLAIINSTDYEIQLAGFPCREAFLE